MITELVTSWAETVFRNTLLEDRMRDRSDGKEGRRHKQLLDDLKEMGRHWKLKDEAPDRTVWKTRFGRGYGPVVIQTTE
jgi:hypothetical protein